MKKNLILAIVFIAFTAVSCKSELNPTENEKNEYVVALQKISSTFSNLSSKVDSISGGLSEIEKERAGYFLACAYSVAMECYVEKGDPAEPGLTNWMSPTRKFGGDNPYTIYTQTQVDTAFVYKLSGKIGNAIYFGVQVYGYANGFNLPTANLGLNNISRGEDDSFEIYLSAKRPENVANWIPLVSGDHAFLVRQYFKDRSPIVPAEMKIERIDNNPAKGKSYLERLANANEMLDDFILGTIDVSSLLQENALNQYANKNAQVRAPKYGGALYPTRDNRYEGCWVNLKPGEALHLHGFLPKNTLYASYVFYDRWYNTPDYRKINSYRTMEEIVLNPDGSFDLYVSPEQINHPNWINTGGLYVGSYSSRYLLSEETRFPEVTVVKISDIGK